MTDDLQKRVARAIAYSDGLDWEGASEIQREEYTDNARAALSEMAGYAQAEVAAAYLDASDFAADTADQGEGPDGVLWADMAQVVDAIESRTPDDAKASLNRLLKAKLQAAVAAEREACAERCEANTSGLTYYGPEPHILDAAHIRARGNTDALAAHDARVKAEALREAPSKSDRFGFVDVDDIRAALERVRQEAKAEALRDLLDLKWTCFHNLEAEVNVVSVHDILALIPDQHKENLLEDQS